MRVFGKDKTKRWQVWRVIPLPTKPAPRLYTEAEALAEAEKMNAVAPSGLMYEAQDSKGRTI